MNAPGCIPAYQIQDGKLIICTSSFSNPKSSYKNTILSHWFNYQVEVVVPCDEDKHASMLSPLKNLISVNNLYKATVSLVEFIDTTFIDKYVKNGQFFCLSQTFIDRDNCFAILPNGKMILSVDKDTYEVLGLVGKPTPFKVLQGQRFNILYSLCIELSPCSLTILSITIDLLAPSFAPGKKFYERVKSCLNKLTPVDCVYCWFKDDKLQEINFSKDKPTKRQTVFQQELLQKVKVPNTLLSPFKTAEKLTDDDLELLSSVYEWLGLVTCRVSSITDITEEPPNPYLCSEPSSLDFKQTSCASLKWRGMIVPQQIQLCLDELRKLVNSNTIKWAAMMVSGYTDAPVSWNENQHNFSFSGENDYAFVLLPNEQYWQFTSLGALDTYS